MDGASSTRSPRSRRTILMKDSKFKNDKDRSHQPSDSAGILNLSS